ncbi:hypothetical protein ILUMI_02610 [Ignelater luminosus]|uniref:Uncharacterized protein n=1 Tax=Ignelater luminosus TaxID=2038154 RepID=A0A8K0DC99_IGNLU|nr:hypothetical protein ILUMI_02610 [Ignelater luminosus]
MCSFIKDVIVIIFIVASLRPSKCSHKHCPTEHSTVNIHGKRRDVVWKTKSDSHYSVVLSDPPCLDINNNLVWRTCYGNVWMTPKDVCRNIEVNDLCPQNFIQEDERCIYITQPQTWERKCPYYGALFAEENYDRVWLPAKRILKYGEIEYILPGEKYGLEITDQDSVEIIEHGSDNNNRDCVINTKSGIQVTTCNALYPHVCSYKYNDFLYRCPNDCIPGGLGSNYCFCKISKNKKNLRRDEWCETLAVPKYSYERKILHKLAGDDTCWIGDLQENSIFVSNLGNLYLAINKREWSLHLNGELNCAICKVNAIAHQRVDLMLKFNSYSKKLFLNVYSPESLFRADDEDDVYCFTDATDKLKQRVEIKKTWDSDWDSHSGRRLKVYQLEISKDGPGYYWCEAFRLPDVQVVSSNMVLAYNKFEGHEYALRLIIYNYCRFSRKECEIPSVEFITRISKNLLSTRFFSKFVKAIRLFHIYNIDIVNRKIDVLLHLSTETKLSFISEYYAMKRNLDWLVARQALVVFFRSSEVCLPEVTDMGNINLNWKLTSIGVVTTPKEVCIRDNGIPVRRQCEGDFLYGSQWGKIDGSCSDNFQLSQKTELLHSIITSPSALSANLTKSISAITENTTDLTVLDLHYLAEALSKVSELNQNNEDFIDEVSEIIDNLMKISTNTLKKSQLLLNVTDEILDTFENMLLSINTNEDLFLLKKDNLVIQISKPFLNNITGLVLYGNDDTSFSDSEIEPLYANATFFELTDEDKLEVAVHVPEKLLNTVSQNMSAESRESFAIITTVFYTDNFFNTDVNETVNSVAGRVVSVSIPGYGEFLQTAIPIIFKSQNPHSSQDCAFWNYGTSSETHTGYWSTVGGDYLGHWNNTTLDFCSFTHLTNFALLIMTDEFSAIDGESVSYNLTTEVHDQVLTVISDIGCTLSLFGISGIFATSMVFQSWREKVGTRILIQLCITIFLQIIFLNIANIRTSTMKLSDGVCTAIGIFLHYIIISEFSWMLVAAILQFFRFVRVIGPMPNRIILKATLVGWGLPVIPTLIVCIVDYHSYSAGVQGICYPKGLSLYFGVLLPIALIVCANLVVFIAVIRNIFILRVETNGNNQILKRQICLAVLLFFLLGLPWIFGLFAEIMGNESIFSYIFIYLFCFTATLQGFVLFLFYVVLDASTRTLWFSLYRRTFTNSIC